MLFYPKNKMTEIGPYFYVYAQKTKGLLGISYGKICRKPLY